MEYSVDAAISIILFLALIPVLAGSIYLSTSNAIDDLSRDMGNKFAIYCVEGVKNSIKMILYTNGELDPASISKVLAGGACPGSSPELRDYKFGYLVKVSVKVYQYNDEAKSFELSNTYSLQDKKIDLTEAEISSRLESVFLEFSNDSRTAYVVKVEVVVWR